MVKTQTFSVKMFVICLRNGMMVKNETQTDKDREKKGKKEEGKRE